jgi:hypothetical protein
VVSEPIVAKRQPGERVARNMVDEDERQREPATRI